MTRPVKFNNTLRDSYQSNLSAAPSATEIVAAEPNAARVGWASVQVGGGTFFDVPVLRGRDPWAEQKILCAAFPTLPKTILVRGDSAVGYNIYAADVVHALVRQYAKTGINGFTIFDGLNDTRNQENAIAAVNACAADGFDVYAQGGICIGSSPAYTVDRALRNADALVKMGARDLYLKDPVGVADAEFVYDLVRRLKAEFAQDVYIHTHNTHGMAYAIYMAAIEAGVDAVDVAHPAAGENVAQPNALRIAHMMRQHPNPSVRERVPHLNDEAIHADTNSIAALRYKYAALEPVFDRAVFDAMLAAKAPGGAASTLKGMMEAQFAARGMSWRDAQIAIYTKQAAILTELGNPLQVTPHAKNTTAFAATRLLMGDKVMTPEIEQYLTGQYGAVPGMPDAGLVTRALVKNKMDAVCDTKPADRVPNGLETARAKLVAAGVEQPTDEDMITVAILNKSDQGLKHVLSRINGTLTETHPPEQPKYTRPHDSAAPLYTKAGQPVPKTAYDVFAALGGGAALLRVALLALDIQKYDHHKAAHPVQHAESRADAVFYGRIFAAWRDLSARDLSDYIQAVPELLRAGGFDNKAQIIGAVDMANAMIRDACVLKGVDDKKIPVVPRIPKGDIVDDARTRPEPTPDNAPKYTHTATAMVPRLT